MASQGSQGAEHTPGPWEVGRYGVHDFEVLGGEGGRSRVAVIRGVIRSTEYDATAEKRVQVDEPVPEAWANAALIADAPTMRAAIDRACEIIETGDQRLLASDGPAGGQPPDLSLAEWRELYRILAAARPVPHDEREG